MFAPGWRWISSSTAGWPPTQLAEADILHIVHRLAEVADADGRAVFVGDDDVVVIVGGKNLVVRVDGVGLPRAVETAFGRVDVVGDDGGANIFQAQAQHAMAAGLICTRTAGF